MPTLSGAGLAGPCDITIVGAGMTGLYSARRPLICGEASSLDRAGSKARSVQSRRRSRRISSFLL